MITSHHFFKEKKEKIKHNLDEWVIIKEGETELVTENPNGYRNCFLYSEQLNEKILKRFPTGKIVYTVQIFGPGGEMIREDVSLILEHEGDRFLMVAEIDLRDIDKTVFEKRMLDENWFQIEEGEYFSEKMKDEFAAFQEEVKNINKYRLHFILQ